MYHPSSSTDKLSAGLADSHLIATTRLILALSAVLIVDYTSVLPFQGDATRLVLVLYIVYSGACYLLAARRIRLQQWVPSWSYWTDIGWFTLLLALSGGSNSIFFFGFFFAILTASFERGFRSGILATAVSAVLFGTVSFAMMNEDPLFERHRILVRLLYLFVLGYLMAHWGGLKTKLKRQLRLLQAMTTLSPPRQGVSNLIASTIDQLRSFYDADTCLLILGNPDTPEYSLHRVKRDNSATPTDIEPIPAEMLQLLLALPAEHAVVSSEGLLKWRRLDHTYDVIKHQSTAKRGDVRRTLTTLLDAKSFITAPLWHHNQTVGRLYLTAQRRRAFDTSDVEFLIQVADQLMPVIDSIRLVDRLALEAADDERKRIARDIHDSIIQPFIGLQMGLIGICRRLDVHNVDLNSGNNHLLELINDAAADTQRLIEITNDEINDLRGFVHGLRGPGDDEGSLIPALRRFAAKFSQATNIVVQVRTDTDIRVDDRVGTEIFQMIVEGLSNIRRHTQSERAFIGLGCSDHRLTLRIENDGTRGSAPKSFTPSSINERAEALGGRAYVETFGDMGTSVIVEIPL